MSKARKYSERELAEAVEAGDRDAMHTLYQRYASMAAGVCRRYTSDPSDGDDMLQNTFVRAITGIGSFNYRGEGSLGAWIRRIAVNEAVAVLRTRSGFLQIDQAAEVADSAPPPDTTSLTAEQILSCVESLPPLYRTIFNLYVVDGRSHAEIAALTGIAPRASATRLFRAKAMLAKTLHQKYDI